MDQFVWTVLLAQGTAPDPRAQTLQLVGMLAIMGFMFYFAIFRPQQKKARQHEALLKALKTGDKVVTSSGLLGIVISLKDRTVSLRCGEAKLEVLKSSIAEVLVDKTETAA